MLHLLTFQSKGGARSLCIRGFAKRDPNTAQCIARPVPVADPLCTNSHVPERWNATVRPLKTLRAQLHPELSRPGYANRKMWIEGSG